VATWYMKKKKKKRGDVILKGKGGEKGTKQQKGGGKKREECCRPGQKKKKKRPAACEKRGKKTGSPEKIERPLALWGKKGKGGRKNPEADKSSMRGKLERLNEEGEEEIEVTTKGSGCRKEKVSKPSKYLKEGEKGKRRSEGGKNSNYFLKVHARKKRGGRFLSGETVSKEEGAPVFCASREKKREKKTEPSCSREGKKKPAKEKRGRDVDDLSGKEKKKEKPLTRRDGKEGREKKNRGCKKEKKKQTHRRCPVPAKKREKGGGGKKKKGRRAHSSGEEKRNGAAERKERGKK